MLEDEPFIPSAESSEAYDPHRKQRTLYACSVQLILSIFVVSLVLLLQIWSFRVSESATDEIKLRALEPIENDKFIDFQFSGNEKELFKPLVDESTWGSIYSSRIFCFIPSSLPEKESEILEVMETWGSDCAKILIGIENYMYDSSKFDKYDNVVIVPLKVQQKRKIKGRRRPLFNMYQKTIRMIQYVFKNYKDGFDWLVKLDDDTYLCHKHLNDFLQYYNPNLIWWIGQPFTHWYPDKYNTGGSGYAFSHALVEEFNAHSDEYLRFGFNSHADDRKLGRTLEKMNVYPQNTLNVDFINRFHQSRYEEEKKGNPNREGWRKNCYPEERENAKNEELFLKAKHITFHGYKTNRTKEFEKLNELVCGDDLNSAQVPPLPRLFLYDLEQLPEETLRRKQILDKL